jgi:hypothetical protein
VDIVDVSIQVGDCAKVQFAMWTFLWMLSSSNSSSYDEGSAGSSPRAASVSCRISGSSNP